MVSSGIFEGVGTKERPKSKSLIISGDRGKLVRLTVKGEQKIDLMSLVQPSLNYPQQ